MTCAAAMLQIAPLPESETDIERAEAALLEGVQPVTFLKHHFAPGIYIREIWMPAGSMILGHRHKTDHLNVITQGKVLVRAEGELRLIDAKGPAPVTFRSGTGVRKALYLLEDTTWLTVHVNPDDCTDIPTLEARYTEPSEVYKQHEIEAARASFRRAIETLNPT
jgi:hypothetical protein